MNIMELADAYAEKVAMLGLGVGANRAPAKHIERAQKGMDEARATLAEAVEKKDAEIERLTKELYEEKTKNAELRSLRWEYRDVLRQALEALSDFDYDKRMEAIAAIKEQLK